MQFTHGAPNYMLRRRDNRKGCGPRLCLIAASLSSIQSAARPIIYYDEVTAINGRGPRREMYLFRACTACAAPCALIRPVNDDEETNPAPMNCAYMAASGVRGPAEVPTCRGHARRYYYYII